MIPIYIIVAVDLKYGYSKNGTIPWNIPEDMKFFYDIITHKRTALIMGTNTYNTMPKTIKNCTMVVVSSKNSKCSSLLMALDNIYNMDDKFEHIFILGGRRLYTESLRRNIIDYIYLTYIKHDYKCDKFFPKQLIDNKFTIRGHNICKYYDGIQHVNIDQLLLYNNYPKITSECSYLGLLNLILNKKKRVTRNGLTKSVFGKILNFDLEKGFPLLTTKKMFFRGIVEELLMFLRGDTNTNILSNNGINIWKKNTSRKFLDSVNLQHYKEGDMGNMYGFQWRHFGVDYKNMNINYKGLGFDQLMYVINLIKKDPNSRRIIMTTFDAGQSNKGCLYPCHGLITQFYIRDKTYIDCCVYMRSQDIFLGTPFNIASYALLMHIIGNICNYKPGKLTIYMGDVHLYYEHINAANIQLKRKVLYFPTLTILKNITKIKDIKYTDFKLNNYNCYSKISVKMIK